MDLVEVQRLMDQSRCLHCKRRSFEDVVTCDWCQECKFCSVECLSYHTGNEFCIRIAVRKGRRQVVSIPGFAEIKHVVVHKAKYLDLEGNVKKRDDNNDHTTQKPSKSDQTNDKKRRHRQRGNRGKGQGNKGKGNKGKGQGKAAGASSTKRVQEDLDVLRSIKQGNGSFGGPVRCGRKDRSGLDFGSGWWKETPPTKENKPKNNESEIVKDLWEKLRKRTQPRHGSTMYDSDVSDDSDDNGEDEKPTAGASGVSRPEDSSRNIQHASETKADQHQSKTRGSSVPASNTRDNQGHGGESSDEKTKEGKGREMVKYDAAKAEEELRRQGKAKEKCDFCENVGYNMMKCSRCKLKKYCGRECQRQDFKDHKEFCKRTERTNKALQQVFNMGVPKVQMSLQNGLIPEHTAMFAELFGIVAPILAEIVGPYFHPWRPGVVIRDIHGFETFVMFYTDEIFYTHTPVTAIGFFNPRFMFPIPIPLSECLKPGNHILLLQPFLHFFADGTRGIRIDDLETEVRFVF